MRGRSVGLVLGATARWCLGLAAVATGFQLWTSASARIAGPWRLAEAAASSVGLLLPIAAFAGGLAAARLAVKAAERARVARIGGAVASVLAYLLLAYAAPVTEMRYDEAIGLATDARYPFGARTPGGLADMLHHVREHPPEQYGFSTDRPLEVPPNWIRYGIHLPAVLALFALVNTLLGVVVGELTAGLAPPRRRHTRWAVGLGVALGFFLASNVAGAWIRGSPERSVLATAWLPLLLPMLVLAAAYALRRRRRALHAPHRRDV